VSVEAREGNLAGAVPYDPDNSASSIDWSSFTDVANLANSPHKFDNEDAPYFMYRERFSE
jgi:hypothetical protein